MWCSSWCVAALTRTCRVCDLVTRVRRLRRVLCHSVTASWLFFFSCRWVRTRVDHVVIVSWCCYTTRRNTSCGFVDCTRVGMLLVLCDIMKLRIIKFFPEFFDARMCSLRSHTPAFMSPTGVGWNLSWGMLRIGLMNASHLRHSTWELPVVVVVQDFFFLFSISSTQVWRTRSHFECSSWRVNAPRTHRPRGGLHFGVKIEGLKKASFLIISHFTHHTHKIIKSSHQHIITHHQHINSMSSNSSQRRKWSKMVDFEGPKKGSKNGCFWALFHTHKKWHFLTTSSTKKHEVEKWKKSFHTF